MNLNSSAPRTAHRSRLAGVVALALSLTLTLVADPSEAARRMGGGKSIGMQRAAPTQQAAPTPPKQATPAQSAQPGQSAAAPAAATAPAAAAPAKQPNRWLGPIAGLAAGLGLAALMSHLGFGEGLANFVMIALLVVGAVLVLRWFMSRGRAAAQPSLATAGGPAWSTPTGPAQEPQRVDPAPMAFEAQRPAGAGEEVSVTGRPLRSYNVASGVAAAAGPRAAPADFDVAGFEQVARALFVRMQAAYDAGDLNDLRRFTTTEVFAQVRLDLQDRGAQPQASDVQKVDARMMDYAEEAGQLIVSVRFQGQIAEAPGAAAEAFDEIWHLVKPIQGEGAWAIAGIQQMA